MTWVGVNGSRVDVILSDDVDEWRVVLGTDDGERVDWLFAYRRPPFFNGVPGGKAVIVNGPSGAGKSTLLDSLRRTEAGMPWVIFDEPEDVGSVDAEFLIWREQAPALHEGFLGRYRRLGPLRELGGRGCRRPDTSGVRTAPGGDSHDVGRAVLRSRRLDRS